MRLLPFCISRTIFHKRFQSNDRDKKEIVSGDEAMEIKALSLCISLSLSTHIEIYIIEPSQFFPKHFKIESQTVAGGWAASTPSQIPVFL